MNILLYGDHLDNVTDAQRAEIQHLAPNLRLLVSEDKAEIEKAIDQIEVATRRFPHDLLPRATQLCWYQQWGAGADWLARYPQAVELPFTLTNASGVHPIQITEHIFALLLAFARGLPRAVQAQAQSEWDRAEGGNIFELYGKTMLLVGVGAIGERTAEVAAALGMRVLGIRRNADQSAPHVEAMYGPDKLLDLLPQVDFVVLTIPFTPETKGLFGRREFEAMKPAAYIVNIGRGGTIDEAALVEAINRGWIAGAGLDVFEQEPLPADSPLWATPNMIVTAHYAGRTPHYEERAIEIFLDNLRRYTAGQPLRNVVDKKLGYQCH
ncbi:MAG: D-2-hydroxyacid dehydrogenase [Anaerolineae bacterium]|nr:D-2-hydroxyacid dehydrogenase [Anaerolineae bacterium]